MADSDLDYAKVIGRFGLAVGDTDDAGDNPDIVFCDEGTVDFIPLQTITKVAAGSPSAFTAGQGVITATISGPTYVDPTGSGKNGAGYITYNGKPFVYLVDLTSSKVNPPIGPDKATHRVVFKNIRAAGTKVDFPTLTAHFTAAGPDASGVNDLTTSLPVSPGESSPIYQGPPGVGIASAAIVGGTNLQLELTDGATVDAGALPVGPGGSDTGVAGYLGTSGSQSRAATRALVAGDVGTPTSDIAKQLSASFVRFLDTNGNPISGHVVTITVNTSTGEIADITFA
ncbi:MAG: hypothetical protein HOV78_11575 [Hamadaea sp.]|nr:hypothetical protein [Hamadaea sp.]